MNKGALLAVSLGLATVVLIAAGTIWPVRAAAAYAGNRSVIISAATPEAAVKNLAEQMRRKSWQAAYDSLANKTQFTEADFERDVSGSHLNLRTYSSVEKYQLQPLHASENEADIRLSIDWATVMGVSVNTRDLRVLKNGDRWEVEWPISKEPIVPPQVIPVTYLRWDVIYRGSGDDWGAQDVEAPKVKIVDMHPVQRADGVVILGELLNQDVIPAYVSVSATLLSKKQTPIATEETFDKISHVLLPNQVTPFLIRFPDAHLSDVGSVRMTPFSTLVSAFADPVIEIEDEQPGAAADATLSGTLVNQSGEIVNVAHVLGTFYDKSGQLIWVADEYVDRALLPGVKTPFVIHIPEDLSRNVSKQHTVVATYKFRGAV